MWGRVIEELRIRIGERKYVYYYTYKSFIFISNLKQNLK
jgi:hypothetical protein